MNRCDAPSLRESPRPELKPCAFCGEAPKVIGLIEEPDRFEREVMVRCDRCAVMIYGEYRSEAIETWNTRAEERPQISPLTVIIDWYQALPKRAREGMSLANLHDLSKRLTSESNRNDGSSPQDNEPSA